MGRFRKMLLFVVVLAAVLWRLSPQAGEFRQIDTGKDLLCLPGGQKGLFSTPPAFDRLIKGSDAPATGRSFLVTFEPEQVRSAVPEYAPEDSGVPAFLYAKITNVGNREALDASLGGGPYAEGFQLRGEYVHVEPVHGHAAYRVSPDPFPDVLVWNVYSIKPSADQTIPDSIEDYHLGQCIIQTRGQRQCYQVTQVDGYRVRFELNEVNLFLKDELRTFLSSQLQTWRENCGRA